MLQIESIYFFEANTKYISSSVLKTSEFSRVHSTRENFYIYMVTRRRQSWLL